MKRILGVALASLVLLGCGKGKGEQLADKINDKVVAKIKAGEIKDEMELAIAEITAMGEAMKELGITEETKTTESDKKKFEELTTKNRETWKKMLAEKKK